jgi:hypothetical protein
MTSNLTKQIEIPWLTAMIIASSLVCGLAAYLQYHVATLGYWALCVEIAWLFGPLWCLFLVCLLVVAFYRTHKQHKFAFGLGFAFGLATFFIWYYVASNH